MQFIFYGVDYERQFQDLLKGAIDAAVTSSTWLVQNHPESLSQLRILSPQHPTYESEPFPFPVSSPLVPQSSLVASPEVPWLLKRHITNALQALNSTHPAAIAAGLSTFTGPAGGAQVRSLMEALSILQFTEAGPACINQWTADDLLTRCEGSGSFPSLGSFFHVAPTFHVAPSSVLLPRPSTLPTFPVLSPFFSPPPHLFTPPSPPSLFGTTSLLPSPLIDPARSDCCCSAWSRSSLRPRNFAHFAPETFLLDRKGRTNLEYGRKKRKCRKILEYGDLCTAQHRQSRGRNGPEETRPSDQTSWARARLNSAFGRPPVRFLPCARRARLRAAGLRVSAAADAHPAPAPRSINCPAGFILQTPVANAAQCGRDGVDCPAGQICFCRPCVPDLQVSRQRPDHDCARAGHLVRFEIGEGRL